MALIERVRIRLLPCLLAACAVPEKHETVTLAPPQGSTTSASLSAIAAAPQHPSVLTIATTPGWSGANGNTPRPITSIWGRERDVVAAGPGALLVSHDRGVHWSITWDAGGGAVWGASALEVFVAGGSTIMRSTDRGESWQKVGEAPGHVAAIGGFAYDVFVAGEAFLAHSVDHGATWRDVPLGFGDETLLDIEIARSGLYLSGFRREALPTSPLGFHTVPVLMVSGNGGRSWSNVTPPNPHQTDIEEIRKLCFTSSETMFVAMAESIQASNDRGASWRMAIDIGAEVLGLACGRHEVIAAAHNKHFFASNDDGVTWREHDLDATLPGHLVLLQAAFIAEGGEAYVGGEAFTKDPAGTLLRRAP